ASEGEPRHHEWSGKLRRWRKALIGVMSAIVLYPVVFYAIVIPASIYNDNALVSASNFPPVAILGGIAATLFLLLFYTPLFLAPLLIGGAMLLFWFPSRRIGALVTLLFALYFSALIMIVVSS
ncbi:MAG: hypothetical protein ABSB56_03070, partial [Nitrososphaerales archaeon]